MYNNSNWLYLQLLYLDSVTCKGLDSERTLAPIAYWTGKRQEDRQIQEGLNGGFGKGEVRELYVDENDYDIESDEDVEVNNESLEVIIINKEHRF